MNSRISEIGNHQTDEGKLECGDQEVQNRVLSLQWGNDDLSCITRSLNPEKEAGEIHNSWEVGLVMRLVTELISCGVEEIGVIRSFIHVTLFASKVYQGNETYRNNTLTLLTSQAKRESVWRSVQCTRSKDGRGTSSSTPGYSMWP